MTARGGLGNEGRLPGVDLARGLAVVGMLAAHLFELPEWSWQDPSSWVAIASGRSSIVFAVLAGVSLALVSGGARGLGDRDAGLVRRRLAVRAALIWALGLVLVATGVPVFVILPAYGVLFLLALPLLGFRAGALAVLATALALATPALLVPIQAWAFWSTAAGEATSVALGWWYPFVVWIVFVVAGLALGRLELRRPRVQYALVGGGAVLATLGYGLAALVPAPEGYWAPLWSAEPHSSGLLEVIGSGGFALGFVGLCLVVCRTPLNFLVLPLRAVGSMPLTAYAGQLLAWAVWAAIALGDVGDLAGFRALEPFWPMTIVLVVACTVWALTLGRGPFEWGIERVVRLAVAQRPRGRTFP